MGKTLSGDKVLPLLKERVSFLGVLSNFFGSLKSQRSIDLEIDSGIHHQLPLHGRSTQHQFDSEFRIAQALDWYMRQRMRTV